MFARWVGLDLPGSTAFLVMVSVLKVNAVINKELIVAEARRWVASTWPTLPEEAGCLYMTLGVILIARVRGIHLIPQGGSVSWLAVHPDHDDGSSPNAAAYQWDPTHPLSRLSLANGWLPEMHCWAADPERKEIVDITTGLQMTRFKSHFDWTAAPLPDFLWGKPETGWHYEPNREACLLAMKCMSKTLKLLE